MYLVGVIATSKFVKSPLEVGAPEVYACIATEVEPVSEMPTMMAEIASLKTELAELKETIKLTLSAVNTIVEAPVVEPIEAKVEFANMTAFQKYKASK